MPFRPKHIRNFSEAELEALEKLNGSPTGTSTPMTPSRLGSGADKKVDLEKLEQAAEQGLNGHS